MWVRSQNALCSTCSCIRSKWHFRVFVKFELYVKINILDITVIVVIVVVITLVFTIVIVIIIILIFMVIFISVIILSSSILSLYVYVTFISVLVGWTPISEWFIIYDQKVLAFCWILRILHIYTRWCQYMERLTTLLVLCADGFSLKRASKTELGCFLCCKHIRAVRCAISWVASDFRRHHAYVTSQ